MGARSRTSQVGAGRPTLLTKELIRAAYRLARLGFTDDAPIQSMLNLNVKTWNIWLNESLAAQDKEPDERTEREEMAIELFATINRGRAERQEESLQLVQLLTTGFEKVTRKTKTRSFPVKQGARIVLNVDKEPVIAIDKTEEIITTKEYDLNAATWFLERANPKAYGSKSHEDNTAQTMQDREALQAERAAIMGQITTGGATVDPLAEPDEDATANAGEDTPTETQTNNDLPF